MRYDVELTETAFENLNTIYNYIYNEIGSPVAAKKSN